VLVHEGCSLIHGFIARFWTQMLENPDCRHVCEWAPDGRHLIIYDPDALMAEIKARGVCKQKDYDSFARQLRVSLSF
jgi:hypothetical protein